MSHKMSKFQITCKWPCLHRSNHFQCPYCCKPLLSKLIMNVQDFLPRSEIFLFLFSNQQSSSTITILCTIQSQTVGKVFLVNAFVCLLLLRLQAESRTGKGSSLSPFRKRFGIFVYFRFTHNSFLDFCLMFPHYLLFLARQHMKTISF